MLVQQEVEDDLRGIIVLDPGRCDPARRLGKGRHFGRRPDITHLRRAKAEVCHAQYLERLLLRSHHSPERCIPWLVEGVAHGHDGRKPGLDHVIAELGLPDHPDRVGSNDQFGSLGDDRQPKPFGDGGPQHRSRPVARLLSEDGQIGVLSGGERNRQEEVRELMQDQFIAELLPFVSQLNGMQMSSVLTQVRDLTVRPRRSA